MLRGFQSKPLTMLRLLGTATILCHYIVSKYTVTHPFLLADNRSAQILAHVLQRIAASKKGARWQRTVFQI